MKLFMQGLRGLVPDGGPDTRFHGRELARNAAVGGLALATGLRLQEFTYLLVLRISCAPTETDRGPDPFPVPSGGDQGAKVPHDLGFLWCAGRTAPVSGAGSGWCTVDGSRGGRRGDGGNR